MSTPSQRGTEKRGQISPLLLVVVKFHNELLSATFSILSCLEALQERKALPESVA